MNGPSPLQAPPASARVLHIGPSDAGAAGLRRGFDARADEAARQGVRWHAGPDTRAAVLAVIGESTSLDGSVPPWAAWRGLVQEVEREADARVVISEDAFADADEAAIGTIVDALGRQSVHVVATLRPLGEILVRHWHAQLLDGDTEPFEPWLDATLHAAGAAEHGFWRRHRLDRLLARWAAAVGPDRVTAIVVDGGSLELFTTLETLLGLRAGTLQRPEQPEDRALTLPEAELVRTLNVAIGREGLQPQRGLDVRSSVAAQLRRRVPRQDEAGVELPDAAIARVAAIAGDMAGQIARSGVRVIGDPAELSRRPEPGAAFRGLEVSEATWADVGAAAAVGTLIAAGLVPAPEFAGVRGGPRSDQPQPARRLPLARVEPLELAGTSTSDLGRVLLQRGFQSARSRLGRVRAAVKPG